MVYIVQQYDEILYAGLSLKEAKKFNATIDVYKNGSLVGYIVKKYPNTWSEQWFTKKP